MAQVLRLEKSRKASVKLVSERRERERERERGMVPVFVG
jgi:hypothetical protein